MKNASAVAAILMATTALTGAAFAANSTAAAPPRETPAQVAADQDFGKLSKDGATAFRDIHMARLAIFQANPDQAKTSIQDAQTALGKAKTDDAVFIKAEADLKPPPMMKADGAMKTKDAQKSDDKSAKAGPPIKWLPIDGRLTLGEDFTGTPEKTAAVNEANKHLQQGDKGAAVTKLKLAGIDVSMTMAIMPLDQTVADVDNASSLIGQGKYYEANAVLKQTEDHIRFDTVDTTAVPVKTATPAKTTTPAPKASH